VSGAGLPGDATLARTAEPVRATVFAGGVETEYLRVGSSTPALLFLAAPDDPDRDSVIRSLGVQGRVVAPSIPAGVDFATWLRDFLDGIGVLPVRIVATEALGAPALLFAAADPSRVEQITLWRSAKQQREPNHNTIP
jgi:hypothetical protein